MSNGLVLFLLSRIRTVGLVVTFFTTVVTGYLAKIFWRHLSLCLPLFAIGRTRAKGGHHIGPSRRVVGGLPLLAFFRLVVFSLGKLLGLTE